MANEEEDLDYHITFPRPGQDEGWSEEATPNVQEFAEEGKRPEPVVYLLGWAGCKDYHLAKYGGIYEERCITIRYTVPTDIIFWKPGGIRPLAVKLLELLSDLGLEENPVFIHAFSNGGGMLYVHMADILKTDPQFADVQMKGIMFDSLPSQRTAAMAAKAFSMSVSQNAVIKWLVSICAYVYFALGSAAGRVLECFGMEINVTNPLYWRMIIDDAMRCPQLCLYSKVDELVSYKYVEQYIESRCKRGVDIWSQCWSDSKHVQHFRYYPEEYSTLCHRFVQHCVASDTSSS